MRKGTSRVRMASVYSVKHSKVSVPGGAIGVLHCKSFTCEATLRSLFCVCVQKLTLANV